MAHVGRILIADDEAAFAEAHADLLRDEGYECDCAGDAYLAKEMLGKKQYDLLIADIRMSGNDELEFIEQTSAIKPGLPVILVTGYPSLNTAIKSTRLAVAGYMVKPLPIDDFLKLVRQAIVRYETFRMFEESRNRLLALSSDLGTYENMKRVAPASTPQIEVEAFLHYTIKNILTSMMDLKHLTRALAKNSPTPHACQLLECPRLLNLTEAIREAIFVLEKTKSAFKSKDLAALRVKLERVLKPEKA